jgi:hypothetical protein
MQKSSGRNVKGTAPVPEIAAFHQSTLGGRGNETVS